MLTQYLGQPYRGNVGLGLLALRLAVGAAFILHGWGKIQHATTWMGESAPVPGVIQALAAIAEFGGGLSLVAGLLTPLGALGIVVVMIAAMAMVHLPMGHPFVSQDPAQPAYELVTAYLSSALLLMMTGAGAYSLDAVLFVRQSSSEPVMRTAL